MRKARRHIGIDFDNTIVSYQELFLKLALERKIVKDGHASDKTEIRDRLRKTEGGEVEWQQVQAWVYGYGMAEAKMMAGFGSFIGACRHFRERVTIISHKTEFAVQDRTVNLWEAAFRWMTTHGFFSASGFGFNRDDVFFESTREEKINRIRSIGCTHYIDDLVEVLTDKDFPESVQRFLFSPSAASTHPQIRCWLKDWQHAKNVFFRESIPG